jgi:hypothetical protein
MTIVMTVIAFAFVASPLLRTQRRLLLIGLGIAVPVVATSLYLYFGSPEDTTTKLASPASISSTSFGMSTAAAKPGGTGKKVGSVSSMVDGLAARLEENPNDGKGWLLLARSYQHINEPAKAAEAYAKANALGEFDQEFENSLAAGSAVETGSADAGGAQIVGELSLSAEAAAVVQPTDTVFIFARGVNASGAPAAVLRRSAADLPINFSLNDSQSMVPGVKLSDFNEVVVSARISRTGNAMEALQGFEAESDVVTLADNERLTLVIQ